MAARTALPVFAVTIAPAEPLPEQRTIAEGPFQPTWESLAAGYRCPDWFRDAKFGIWAHWGSQCVPEDGDWYARNMYLPGHEQWEFHRAHFGHPSEFGYMEINKLWKAEKWDPESLMDLYVEAGAKYFVAMANHEDNFDAYASRYHAWNSVNVGPLRDVIGTWARVARERGLPIGVSNHSSHAWHWFQTAYGYDPEGPLAGVRYDAFRLTKDDGVGKWWEGLDPQELYCAPVLVMPEGIATDRDARRWHSAHTLPWTEKAPESNPRFVDKWFFRLKDLIDRYDPDFLYLDNAELPFGQTGLDIAAHFYNAAVARHGELDVVLTAKGLSNEHRPAVVQDWERSVGNRLMPQPFETDTCIGQWHYKREMEYKSAAQVVRILVDVVSKNGTLLLSIPQRGNGTIDEREVGILKEIGRWMQIHGEGIYGTRPWHRFGEGPTRVPRGRRADAPLPYTQEDFRFTTKGDALYVFVMANPRTDLTVESLALDSEGVQTIASVVRLGAEDAVNWEQTEKCLRIELPERFATNTVFGYRVTFE